jgi:hypothetical protein
MSGTVQDLKQEVTKLKREAAKFKAMAALANEAGKNTKAALRSRVLELLSDQTFNWSEFKSNPDHTLKHLFGE